MKKPKRSVSSITQFIGWNYLLNLEKKTVNLRDQALISLLFLTGGRVSEVLQLAKSNFTIKKKYVIVESMTVLKKYKKIDKEVIDGKVHWITEKVKCSRTFPIGVKEPLTPYFIDYLDNKNDKLFKIKRRRVHQIVTGLDQNVFPHWFRAQRASQLASEYGFTIHDLIDFFSWKDLNTALHYSRMGWKELAKKMR